MPPVRKERVATRTNNSAISQRCHVGQPTGSTRQDSSPGTSAGVPLQGNIADNVHSALPSQPTMVNLNERTLEDLITSGIAKGVEMGVAKALSVIGPLTGSAVAPTATTELTAVSPASSSAENAIVASSLPKNTK